EPVRRHVAEVAAAARAMHFRAPHEEMPVLARAHRSRQGPEEARPAGAAVELGVRAEAQLAAAPAAEGTGALLIIQRAAAGALGAVRPQHPVGLGRELPPPLLVGLLDREMLALGTRHSSGTRSSATMLMILISGLMAGPAVSLQGSPTVSPVTAALCASDPLPPNCPSSMYFLALSHAPPEFERNTAMSWPVRMTAARKAPRAK